MKPKKPTADSRLKCIYAKKDKFGDIVCKIRFTDGEKDNCDYGKGICKDYIERTLCK